jgi:citrate lyase beta subunit
MGNHDLGVAWLLGMVLDDKRFERAVASCADNITMDLEDAVVAENKAKARERACEIVRDKARMLGGRPAWVRINDLFTPWGRDDLAQVIDADVDGIVYPAVRGAEEIWQVRRTLDERGSRAKLKIIFETPQAFFNIQHIMVVPGIHSLTHGAGDLTLETGIDLDEAASLAVTATQTVIAARAFGAHVTDGIHLRDWRNEDAVRNYVRRAKRQGFDGLNSFYLPHMKIIKEVFTPTDAELSFAARAKAAYEEGMRNGVPAVVVDGRAVLIHDYHRACRLLEPAGSL